MFVHYGNHCLSVLEVICIHPGLVPGLWLEDVQPVFGSSVGEDALARSGSLGGLIVGFSRPALLNRVGCREGRSGESSALQSVVVFGITVGQIQNLYFSR